MKDEGGRRGFSLRAPRLCGRLSVGPLYRFALILSGISGLVAGPLSAWGTRRNFSPTLVSRVNRSPENIVDFPSPLVTRTPRPGQGFWKTHFRPCSLVMFT